MVRRAPETTIRTAGTIATIPATVTKPAIKLATLPGGNCDNKCGAD
jgi:hypothetical protein